MSIVAASRFIASTSQRIGASPSLGGTFAAAKQVTASSAWSGRIQDFRRPNRALP